MERIDPEVTRPPFPLGWRLNSHLHKSIQLLPSNEVGNKASDLCIPRPFFELLDVAS